MSGETSCRSLLNVVVLGARDAGKSTLLGHMLAKMGSVDSMTLNRIEQEANDAGQREASYAWVSATACLFAWVT